LQTTTWWTRGSPALPRPPTRRAPWTDSVICPSRPERAPTLGSGDTPPTSVAPLSWGCAGVVWDGVGHVFFCDGLSEDRWFVLHHSRIAVIFCSDRLKCGCFMQLSLLLMIWLKIVMFVFPEKTNIPYKKKRRGYIFQSTMEVSILLHVMGNGIIHWPSNTRHAKDGGISIVKIKYLRCPY
jgi:hypothetical protein